MNSVVITPSFTGFVDTNFAPDPYVFDRTKGAISPRNDFVVSRNKDGTILSHYRDDIWDFSVYDPTGSKKLRFENIEDPIHRAEAKKLAFLHLVFGKGKSGTVMAPTTLYKRHQRTVVPLCRFAKKESLTLKEFFESENALEKYGKKLMLEHVSLIPDFTSLISFLAALDNENTGIDIKRPKALAMRLGRWYYSNYNIEQTPVIPVSIFKEASAQRWAHFEKAYSHADNLIGIIGRIAENPLYAVAKTRGKASNGEYYTAKTKGFVSWNNAVSECGLNSFFNEYDVKNRRELEHYMGSLFYTCKHLILSYTGMRNDEVKLLEHGSMGESKQGKTTQIIGVTKKVHGVLTENKWVTAPEIKKVVFFMERIGQFVFSKRLIDAKEKPLFVSMKLVRMQSVSGLTSFKDLSGAYKDAHNELPLIGSSILIQEEHIRELESITPGRDWRGDEKFKVGKPWPFGYHQYRRSLAVYALNSGVVSIAALEQQFGHLFREMTAYYGNGAGSAKSLVGADDPYHLKSEMKRIKPIFDFLSYAKNVLFSDEPSYGSHGNYVNKREESVMDYILDNRENTIKKFEKGIMYYKETVLGGCTSPEPCDSHLMGSFVACFGCEGADLKKKKVKNAIREQKEFLEELEEGTMEYRMEDRELKILEDNYEIMKRKENGGV